VHARFAADSRHVVAQPHARLHPPFRRLHWRRLPLAATVALLVCGADISWKAATLAASPANGALDAPSSLLRPLATLLIGLAALSGVLLLPRLCLPGVLLVVGGVSSNVASLALWKAVPNPMGLNVAGGVLHLCLADLFVWSGGVLFLASALWVLWRMPDEQFAALVAR
jgi:hypothetical protein